MAESTGSLVLFSQAASMLAEADTIQKAHELRSLALTAADWAQRKGLGEEAIRYARSYALDAERRLGELLRETELSSGGRPPETGNGRVPVSEKPPTLAALGLSKRASAEAQRLAALPTPVYEEIKAGQKTRMAAKREWKRDVAQTRMEHRRQQAATTATPVQHQLYCGDFVDTPLEPGTVDAIITDPPYPREFLDCYRRLFDLAAEILKPGGRLLAMCGQSYLPEILAMFLNRNDTLTYQWTMAYLTPGSSVQVFGRRVKSNWKPIIYAVKEQNTWEHVEDCIRSDSADKQYHEWGQNLIGITALVKRFTVENELVFDPFVGGGTTAIAALLTKRRFIGADIDALAIKNTNERIASLQ